MRSVRAAACLLLAGCGARTVSLDLPADIDWVGLVGTTRSTGLHLREHGRLELDDEEVIVVGYASADLGATAADAERLSPPLERTEEPCALLPPARYAIDLDTRDPVTPPRLSSPWVGLRCSPPAEGLALESSCAASPFSARIQRSACDLTFELELPWAANLEHARIGPGGLLCVPEAQGCDAASAPMEMSCAYEMESCQVWVREPRPIELEAARVELAPPSFPASFDFKTPDTLATGALLDLALADDGVAVLVAQPTAASFVRVSSELTVESVDVGSAQRIAIDPRDSARFFTGAVDGPELRARMFEGTSLVKTATVEVPVQPGFGVTVADMLVIDDDGMTVWLLVHYFIQTAEVRAAPLGDRLVGLSADDLSVRVVATLQRLGPSRLLRGPPSGRGLYLVDDMNDATYPIGTIADLKPTIGLADVAAIDWQGFGSGQLFTIGSLGHAGALFVGNTLLMSMVGDVTAAVGLREGEYASLAPVYSQLANPGALAELPSRPGTVLVGLRDRATPMGRARVGLLDLATRHMRAETLELGMGAVNEAVTDAAGNVWFMLSWEGALVRVSPTGG